MKNAPLCERINAYLGRPAVAQLKFSQGALLPRPPAPKPSKPAGPLPPADPSRRYHGPEGLKHAALQAPSAAAANSARNSGKPEGPHVAQDLDHPGRDRRAARRRRRLVLSWLGDGDDSAASAAPPTAGYPITAHDMTMGNPKAKVVFIEYAAPMCPHCAHFNDDVMPEIKKAYIDTGKVFYVFRIYPIGGGRRRGRKTGPLPAQGQILSLHGPAVPATSSNGIRNMA